MRIKPIETKYRGYRFRSRLEARWAVFFDTAKIRWQYEPQGFDVGGTAYLPDLHCYFEVKGTSEYDMNLLQHFAHLIGKDVVIAEGVVPDPDEWDCGDEKGLQVLHASRAEEWPDGFIDS